VNDGLSILEAREKLRLFMTDCKEGNTSAQYDDRGFFLEKAHCGLKILVLKQNNKKEPI